MKIDRNFNMARKSAYSALLKTLDKCFNNEGISEAEFARVWHKEIQRDNSVIASGWYTPPPEGIAVLSGSTTHSSRISYDSLRNSVYWPGENVINWRDGLLYLYCSPVSQPTGVPGDLSLTLYFGADKEIIRHFKHTYDVTNRILDSINKTNNSRDLCQLANEIIAKNSLIGCGLSQTDPAQTNFGHTLPCVGKISESKLTNDHISLISKSRRFINGMTNWEFEDGIQFTFEPQLMDANNLELPQISYHFLINKRDDIYVCDDIVDLLRRFNLC